MTDFNARRQLQLDIEDTYKKIHACVEQQETVRVELGRLVERLGELLAKQKPSLAVAMGYEETAADDGAANDE